MRCLRPRNPRPDPLQRPRSRRRPREVLRRRLRGHQRPPPLLRHRRFHVRDHRHRRPRLRRLPLRRQRWVVAGVYNAARKCVVAEDLSCDQTPFRKDEYERVRRCGARVLSVDQVEGIKDPEVQSWGDEESDEGDPPRLWVQNGMYPGTAFTRSIGDSTAEGIGVTATPEVKELKISPDHLFFMVASDGVFEFLSSQAVVNMVASFKDPRDACAAITAESYKIWLEHENRTDDITIVIVHIKDLGDSDSVVTDETSQISSRASQLTSEKPRVEGHAFRGPGTGHARRGSSVSELQGIADFTIDRSPACVAPSPEHKVTFKT